MEKSFWAPFGVSVTCAVAGLAFDLQAQQQVLPRILYVVAGLLFLVSLWPWIGPFLYGTGEGHRIDDSAPSSEALPTGEPQAAREVLRALAPIQGLCDKILGILEKRETERLNKLDASLPGGRGADRAERLYKEARSDRKAWEEGVVDRLTRIEEGMAHEARDG